MNNIESMSKQELINDILNGLIELGILEDDLGEDTQSSDSEG